MNSNETGNNTTPLMAAVGGLMMGELRGKFAEEAPGQSGHEKD